jgi:hypothetical protein
MCHLDVEKKASQQSQCLASSVGFQSKLTFQDTSEYVSENDEESIRDNRLRMGHTSTTVDDADQKELNNYEAALDKIGFGKFQWLLLFVCGLANASDAVEILCVSFVLPTAECDLNLTSADKGVLNAITFLGMD